jgi:hypothetical protein
LRHQFPLRHRQPDRQKVNDDAHWGAVHRQNMRGSPR